MTDKPFPDPELSSGSTDPIEPVPVRSLRELIDRVTGRGFQPEQSEEESGRVEILPFPFLAMVGQTEMKLALVLALINPNVGGVLLIGPRGTGKTTAVRSLVDLLHFLQSILLTVQVGQFQIGRRILGVAFAGLPIELAGSFGLAKTQIQIGHAQQRRCIRYAQCHLFQ